MKKTLLTIRLVWMCFSLSAQKINDSPDELKPKIN